MTKIEVDSFDVGKRIPACQLLAIAQKSQPHHELTCLYHPLRLLGTKSVHNYITLFQPPAIIPGIMNIRIIVHRPVCTLAITLSLN